MARELRPAAQPCLHLHPVAKDQSDEGTRDLTYGWSGRDGPAGEQEPCRGSQLARVGGKFISRARGSLTICPTQTSILRKAFLQLLHTLRGSALTLPPDQYFPSPQTGQQ